MLWAVASNSTQSVSCFIRTIWTISHRGGSGNKNCMSYCFTAKHNNFIHLQNMWMVSMQSGCTQVATLSANMMEPGTLSSQILTHNPPRYLYTPPCCRRSELLMVLTELSMRGSTKNTPKTKKASNLVLYYQNIHTCSYVNDYVINSTINKTWQ